MRWIGAWFTASLLTAVAASLIQTELNLRALAQLGADVPFPVRLQASAHDLLHFAPLFAVLVGLGHLIGFATAELLARRFPSRAALFFPLAGLASIGTMLASMHLALPVTVIAAARTPFGIGLLLGCGAFGGWLFERLRSWQALADALARRSARGR